MKLIRCGQLRLMLMLLVSALPVADVEIHVQLAQQEYVGVHDGDLFHWFITQSYHDEEGVGKIPTSNNGTYFSIYIYNATLNHESKIIVQAGSMNINPDADVDYALNLEHSLTSPFARIILANWDFWNDWVESQETEISAHLNSSARVIETETSFTIIIIRQSLWNNSRGNNFSFYNLTKTYDKSTRVELEGKELQQATSWTSDELLFKYEIVDTVVKVQAEDLPSDYDWISSSRKHSTEIISLIDLSSSVDQIPFLFGLNMFWLTFAILLTYDTRKQNKKVKRYENNPIRPS